MYKTGLKKNKKCWHSSFKKTKQKPTPQNTWQCPACWALIFLIRNKRATLVKCVKEPLISNVMSHLLDCSPPRTDSLVP